VSSLIEQARDFLFRRRTAYVKTFLNPFGDEVLRDLAKFCRAHATTFHAEGRREVFLRIAHHLNLSEDELWRLYGNNSAPVRNPNE